MANYSLVAQIEWRKSRHGQVYFFLCRELPVDIGDRFARLQAGYKSVCDGPAVLIA